MVSAPLRVAYAAAVDTLAGSVVRAVTSEVDAFRLAEQIPTGERGKAGLAAVRVLGPDALAPFVLGGHRFGTEDAVGGSAGAAGSAGISRSGPSRARRCAATPLGPCSRGHSSQAAAQLSHRRPAGALVVFNAARTLRLPTCADPAELTARTWLGGTPEPWATDFLTLYAVTRPARHTLPDGRSKTRNPQVPVRGHDRSGRHKTLKCQGYPRQSGHDRSSVRTRGSDRRLP